MTTSPEGRLWRFAFLALLVLECMPFWIFQYFPSQDGPSHLHNASVIAHYGTEVIYRQYYYLNLFPYAGNMLTHFVLAALLKVVPPLLAEKLLLSVYVILLFVSFRYFLSALTSHVDQFSVFAAILAPNAFIYMGFWNFAMSVPLLLFVLGYYARRQQRLTPRSFLLLMAGGMILYLTHAVSWVICVVAVAVLGFPYRLGSSVRSTLLQYALPICALILPAILMLTHMAHSHEQSTCPVEPLRQRLWYVYSLSFLQTTVVSGHLIMVKAIAVAVLIAFLFMLSVVFWRKDFNWSSSRILALSLICAVTGIFGPDCVGTGSYIHMRIILFAGLFFVTWLACALVRWPRRLLDIVGAMLCGIALIVFVISMPILSAWNTRLTSIALAGQHIRPRSTVLTVNLETHKRGPWSPYLHVTGLLTSRVIIDLSNYEATTDYFLTRFRPDHSPFPALGTLNELEAAPPSFDILRYEKETKGRVDYLLFLGGDSLGAARTIEDLVDMMYGNQIAAYSLVQMPEGQHGNVRLYQHVPGGVKDVR